jgi:hypothetical protein
MANITLTQEEEEQLYFFYRTLQHELIRDIVLHEPHEIAYLKLKPESQLKRLWHLAWTYSGLRRKPAMDGFTCHVLSWEGYEAVVFTFPEPVGATNAWMAAALRQSDEDSYRYFTLEDGIYAEGEAPFQMICEWKQDRHTNFGRHLGPIPTPDAFVRETLVALY